MNLDEQEHGYYMNLKCFFISLYMGHIQNPDQSVNHRKRDNILRNHLKSLRLDSCGLLSCPIICSSLLTYKERIMAQNKVSVMSHVSRHKVSRGMVKKKKSKEKRKVKKKRKRKRK